MRACWFLIFALVLVVMTLPVATYAGTFFDDFNNGNANAWWFVCGHWFVQNGQLVQNAGGDGEIALVKNLVVSSQSITTYLRLETIAGAGGAVIWYQDYGNQIGVYVYPAVQAIVVVESINGQATAHYYWAQEYGFSPMGPGDWYLLGVNSH